MQTHVISSTIFVASIKVFNGSNVRPSTEDKNHLNPIILDVVAGSCPNKRVLSGTVAERAGMVIGNTYLCKVEEIDPNEFGRQFRFSTIVQMDATQILEAIKTLGMPILVEVVENSPEITKSGHFTYPKGLTLEEKAAFNSLDADEQDKWIKKHSEARVQEV